MNYFLVVDDSLVDRRVAGQLIEGHTQYHVEYACDGQDALELLEYQLPLAMVTDLQMPEMDGMQLIEAVRHRFPAVPIIVMTAHGSEDIALQALALGAADYVPKSQLVSELPKSVDSVLAIMAGERGNQRLAHCLRRQELDYELENDVLLIPSLVRQLEQAASDLQLIDKADRLRFSKALVEALRNAIYHGNLELSAGEIETAAHSLPDAVDVIAARRRQSPYCNRRVHVHAVLTPQEGRFTIRDEGPGFDISRLPNVKADPTHLSRGGGHGWVLIQMFMDEVTLSPAGNEITFVKRRPQ